MGRCWQRPSWGPPTSLVPWALSFGWNPSSPAQGGWMGTEQGWHLLLARMEPSFLCLRCQDSALLQMETITLLFAFTGGKVRFQENRWQTPGAWVFSQMRDLTHAALPGREISLGPSTVLTPAAVDTGPWNAAPWWNLIFPVILSLTRSSKETSQIHGQAIEIVPSTDK